MPICTYGSEHDLTLRTQRCPKELTDLIDEIRELTGERYFLEMDVCIQKSWRTLFKPVIKTRFTLYAQVDGEEFQVINFPPLDGEQEYSSINTAVNFATAWAWLMGLRNGIVYARRGKDKIHVQS